MTRTNGPVAESQDPAPRPARRRFSPEYKLRIVAEYDAAPTGEKGAILRRERGGCTTPTSSSGGPLGTPGQWPR